MFKYITYALTAAVSVALLASCSSAPTPHDHRSPASYRGPASGPRAYRIYATAGSYGLAWGCENQLTDFERMDYDQAYEDSLISKNGCKVQNHLINTYEDRIVKDMQDEDYWVVRSHGMNHAYRGIQHFGEISSTTEGRVNLYSIVNGAKWTSTEILFVSVLPSSDGVPVAETPYFCAGCTDQAEQAIVKALKWEKKVANHVVSMSFERAMGNSNNEVTAVYTAEVPKSDSEKYYEARAIFKVEFDLVKKVFSLKLVKVLKSSAK